MSDVIDTLVGIAPGSPLDAVRGYRPTARTYAQRSHDALFNPAEPGSLAPDERHAVGLFVALLHGAEGVAGLHAEALAGSGGGTDLPALIGTAAAEARADGPYGHYPSGPLSRENLDGPRWVAPAELRSAIGERLTAALEHAHLLILHPRDAAPGALNALRGAGWSPDEVVTLSQIIAFSAFQIRVVAGLNVLAARS